MPWSEMTTEAWVEIVSDEIKQLNNFVGLSFAQFQMPPSGYDRRGSIHNGSLRVDGDFIPPSQITAVFGDLEVSGRITTQGVDGADGNTILLVFGSLEASTLVNDWASLILVSQDVIVREWALMDQEDSSFVVGGNFFTPLFVGYDICATVGGTAVMEAGIGYAVGMDANGQEDFDRVVHPKLSNEATERLLQLGEDEVIGEHFYETGTIIPSR